MTETPEFLFLVTSTALILGVVITVRGLLGFRPTPEAPALATATASAGTPSAGSSSTAAAQGESATTSTLDDVATTPPAPDHRDLKEPMIMTLAGVIIATTALFALAALVNGG